MLLPYTIDIEFAPTIWPLANHDEPYTIVAIPMGITPLYTIMPLKIQLIIPLSYTMVVTTLVTTTIVVIPWSSGERVG